MNGDFMTFSFVTSVLVGNLPHFRLCIMGPPGWYEMAL